MCSEQGILRTIFLESGLWEGKKRFDRGGVYFVLFEGKLSLGGRRGLCVTTRGEEMVTIGEEP